VRLDGKRAHQGDSLFLVVSQLSHRAEVQGRALTARGQGIGYRLSRIGQGKLNDENRGKPTHESRRPTLLGHKG
jgi:hypothetical protein